MKKLSVTPEIANLAKHWKPTHHAPSKKLTRPKSFCLTRLGPEKADDSIQRADTYLDVIEFTKSSAGIQFAPLDEEAAHGAKRRIAFLLTKLVERLHYRAIQISRPKFQTAILCDRRASLSANLQISIVGGPDLFERLCVGKIEAITQVNHRAQNGGMFNFAVGPFAFRLGPASRPRRAVLPKVKPVAEPVPRILAGMQGIFQRNDFCCDANIAPVIPDDEGMGNHQRNCGFNSPFNVYIPVAARKRSANFLFAAMRLPVARNWRTSASAAVALLAGWLKIVFTR